MEFRILGPLAVENRGAQIPLGGRRQRIVLATLLLEANRVVPITTLMRAVWGENVPQTAHNQIQICVVQLRRALLDTEQPNRTLVTHSSGYMLRVGPDELDSLRFDDLRASAADAARAGDPVRAVQDLRAALALWQGAALQDVDSGFVRANAPHLDEHRLLAQEQCIELELSLGRHQRLIGELLPLIDEYPLRERLRGFLMLALYRAGRQAEALAAYRDFRSMLAETTGLEPDDELRKLERAVLNQDSGLKELETPGRASLSVPAGPAFQAPRQLPPVVSAINGRDAELARIPAILDRPLGSSLLPLAVITGRSGVGKTELAVHAAHAMSETYGDGHLYIDLRGDEGTGLDPGSVLSRFLRALGVDGSAVPPSLDERATLFRSIVADRAVLVVLDNAGSSEQIRPLLPGGGPCAVLITSRRRPAGIPESSVIRLDALAPDAALELLAQEVGPERVARETVAARELVAQCGGLPLAMRVAGARLAARLNLEIETVAARLGDARLMLDELSYADLEVRTSLEVGYRGLSGEARELLRGIGLLTISEIPLWSAAAILDRDLRCAAEIVEQLLDAHFLEIRDQRYVCHNLIRAFARERVLAEDSEEWRTAMLTRVVGAALFLTEEAHNRLYGGAFGILHGEGARWPIDAPVVDGLLGDDSLEWLDSERATLLAAVSLAADHGLDELCWDLAVTASTLFEARNYADEWRSSHVRALAAIRTAGNRRGEAALLRRLGVMHCIQNLYSECRDLVGRAAEIFDELGDRHGYALTLCSLANQDRISGDVRRSLVRYEAAIEDLRAVGDRAAEADALRDLAQLHLERGDLPGAHACVRRSLAICDEIGTGLMRAMTLHRLGQVAFAGKEYAAATGAFSDALDLLAKTEDRIGQLHVLTGLAECFVATGDARAAAYLGRALIMARELRQPHAEGRVLSIVGGVQAAAGQPDEARRSVRQALAIFERLGSDWWRKRALAVLHDLGLEPEITSPLGAGGRLGGGAEGAGGIGS
ncbi:AfsR/SARP family transcriptional regulator [Streptosporangium sp. KLBMP 9127]|nr:NB-ARC domain-containing protein [Streptosporangium sp. KLBMP 9127]